MTQPTQPPTRLTPTGLQAPDGKRFSWGPIQTVHTVGRYDIVEYLEDLSTCRQPETWHRHGRTLFHPYIDGKDSHHSYASLDSALVGVVGLVREGPNGRAAEYFDLMTGVDPS